LDASAKATEGELDMNYFQWVATSDTDEEYSLTSADGNVICSIWKSGENEWEGRFEEPEIRSFLLRNVNSSDKAKWQATLLLCSCLNEKANYLLRIRDKLPSILELAEKAGVV
jgi:hypothetical protein